MNTDFNKTAVAYYDTIKFGNRCLFLLDYYYQRTTSTIKLRNISCLAYSFHPFRTNLLDSTSFSFYYSMFKVMIVFPAHFIQHWLNPQNQLFLKKISLVYSKHLLPFYRTFLSRSGTKSLIQYPTSLPYKNKQKIRFKTTVAPTLHKSFLNMYAPLFFTRFESFRIINKRSFSSKSQISPLKKGLKKSLKTSLLVKALVTASKCYHLQSPHTSFALKNNLRLQSDLTKRLNTFIVDPTLPLNPTQRLRNLPLVFKMLDLFFSLQIHRKRKFHRQSFVEHYIPNLKTQLKLKNRIFMKQQRWSYHLDKNFSIHTPHSALRRSTIFIGVSRGFKSSKPTPHFIQTSLYIQPENSFQILPNTVLFAPQKHYTSFLKLVGTTAVSNFAALSLRRTKIANPKTKLFSTYNRFQTGSNLPLFLNLENLYNSSNLSVSTQVVINRYLHLTSFVTTLTTKRFLLLLTLQHKVLLARSNWTNTENVLTRNRTLYIHSTKFNQLEQLNQNGNNRLTSIRFKPGYARQWRGFRQEFVEFFSLKKRYQYRLTRYITRLTVSHRKNHVLFNGLPLNKALVLSKLATDLNTANMFINTGLTSLNGNRVTNISTQLLQNDFIQLTVFIKYYVIYKVQKNQLLQSRRMLGHLMWKLGKKWKKNNLHYPLWVKKFNTSFFDIPLTLEVDYFSSSCYILNPKHLKSSQHPYVLPLYNWKYIV